jgi:flagellar biosynthesis/type III secretory pathway protein FliH
MMPKPPELLAKLTVQKVFNRYQAAARAIAEDEEASAIEDADVLAAALHQYSDDAIENIAREAANDAFRSGRADGLEEIEDEMGQNLVWRRGSVLEESTCGPCADADGSEIDGPDADLSDICDGGSKCRCIQYADMDEVKEAA